MRSRSVPAKEEQFINPRDLFEMILAGNSYAQVASTLGMSAENCRKRFLKLARLSVRRRSPMDRHEPPFDTHQVMVMRQHKEEWLRAYDHAVEPISISECQQPEMISIAQLRLSFWAEACLRKAGITTLADLLNTTEQQIVVKRRFGKKTLGEIKALLTRLGLSFKAVE